MAQTTRTAVANAITTSIKDEVAEIVGYNTPQHAIADAYPLPIQGDVLRVIRGTEGAVATALDKDTEYNLTSTTGDNALGDPYDQYTIAEYGSNYPVLKWATYTTALDLRRLVVNKLTNIAARTQAGLTYDALAAQAGLQWFRVDGTAETNVQVAASINSATGLLTTACRTTLTDIDDWWNNGQITFYTGENRGLSRKVTDFANSNGLVTFDAFPQAPANGDKFFITVLGNDTASGPSDLAATDTITLAALYDARERCLRFGAGGIGFDDEVYNVSGTREKRDGMLNEGMVFMPTRMVAQLQKTLAGNTAAQDQAFWQTSEGLRRAAGGRILNVGGLMVVPVNYYKQAAITDGALAVDSGVAHPSLIVYPHAFGCTTLRQKKGDKQGLKMVVKGIEDSDPAYKYDSMKYRGELTLINAYFALNALHGAVVWAGTSAT